MINNILTYLDELFPNPKCELNYNNDFELLIAIVLSAQTTDKKVNKVTKNLFNKYRNIEELSNASIQELENIIKEIGTNKKKSIYIKSIAKRLYEDGYSKIPNDRKYLESLPGVGRKSVNVFLSNIYQEPLIAVDTHVERVSKRLNLSKENDNVKDVENNLMKLFPKDKWIRLHHQLVLFGRYKCKAIKPLCEDCKLKNICKKNEQ